MSEQDRTEGHRELDPELVRAAFAPERWWTPSHWRLPGAIALSAVVQLGFVLTLPAFELDAMRIRPALMPDRFVSVRISPPPPARRASAPAPESKPVQEPRPAAEPKAKPEPKPKVERKRKPRRKKARRQRRKKRKRAKVARAAEPAAPKPAPALVPQAPAPPPKAPAAPVGLASNTLLNSGGIVLDLDLSGGAVSGGSGGGNPWAVVGGSGETAGSGGDAGDGEALRAYEVDRLPTCPKLKPPYPDKALAEELEADVVLRLKVDRRGRVARVQLKRKAGEEFDEAAMRAARRLRCEPAIQDGEPAAVWIDYEVAFRVVAWGPLGYLPQIRLS